MLSGALTFGSGDLERRGEYDWVWFRLDKFWSIDWFKEAVVVALRPLSLKVTGI